MRRGSALPNRADRHDDLGRPAHLPRVRSTGRSSAISFGSGDAPDCPRRSGRKPVVTPEILRKACALIGQALNEREAAVRLKVSKIALYKALASSACERALLHDDPGSTVGWQSRCCRLNGDRQRV